MGAVNLMYKSNMMYLSIFCMIIYIFFNANLTIMNYLMLCLAIFFSFMAILVRGGKLVFVDGKTVAIFIIILMYSLLSLHFTPNVGEGLRFFIILFFIFIYYVALTMDGNAYLFAMRAIAICSAMHVLFTFLQILIPDFVTTINSVILIGERYNANLQFLRWGYYSGICNQTSMNAFYISMFICVSFSAILNYANSKKITNNKMLILYYIIMLLGMVALIATQKRGILVANVMAMFFTMLLCLNNRRKMITKFVSISVILFISSWVLLEYNTLAQKLYVRFTDNSNFMSNRDIIYVQVFESFLKSPIWGNGVASTYSIVSVGAHNIYLQLLNDYGILGTALFFALYLSIFCKSVVVLNECKNLIKRDSGWAIIISIYIQIYFIVYGMVGNPLYDNFIFFTYIIACSVPCSIYWCSVKLEKHYN